MEMIKAVLIKNIRQLRKDQKWTQEILAEKTGYSLAHIKDIERGRSGASLDMVEKFCEVFNVKFERIFSSDEGVKVLDMPMNKAIKKLLMVPDNVYELASEINNPKNEVWDEVQGLLEDALEEIREKKKSNQA
jgi:transcriptional regulator with XRE-family HTH domain